MLRRLIPLLFCLPLCFAGGAVSAREVVEASEPVDMAVTVYRDPNRSARGVMNRDWPQGFAMISETRQVTLPAGESTIRFTGVAEGMVAVSAIVTGLPGGTIEKNRNADLLSPASLVDGTLGNRVRITRTNPATGVETSQSAVIRTRADGGLVLQTRDGFEAVRCSGLPERLSFDDLPDGLLAQPVFTIDTADDLGGTYDVTLTYLAWGFDWQADYVATVLEPGQRGGGDQNLDLNLISWLTILNDNGQSFENAELMAVAGTLNIVSNFQSLASPPAARGLSLSCYPLGSSLAGSPIPNYSGPIPMPVPMAMEGRIMVTAQRMDAPVMESAMAITTIDEDSLAGEEDLGALKLYRVPQPVDVNAQGLKQIAFLSRGDVEGSMIYQENCSPYQTDRSPHGADILFETVNDEAHGLGVALPSGLVAFFEPSSHGDLLIAEEAMRDHASGQDVELLIGQSNQVFAQCTMVMDADENYGPEIQRMRASINNANPFPVTVRLQMGSAANWEVLGIRTRLKDGQRVATVEIPANESQNIEWRIRSVDAF